MASPLPFMDLTTTSNERLAVGSGADCPCAGPPVADRLGCEPSHRQDSGDAAREERLVGLGEIPGCEPGLVRVQTYAVGPTQNPVAGGAGQDRAGERRRGKLVASDDE